MARYNWLIDSNTTGNNKLHSILKTQFENFSTVSEPHEQFSKIKKAEKEKKKLHWEQIFLHRNG